MRIGLGLAAVLVLTACGVQAPAVAPKRHAAVERSMALVLTPEQALKRAASKAQAWQPDARLVVVSWAVAKVELTSVVFHLFQSPKTGGLFLVESKLVSLWQNTREITDREYTVPARLFDTLDAPRVDAHAALAAAKTYLPEGEQHPIALLVLVKPTRFAPPVWGVKAGDAKVLIDARTGKVWAHTTQPFPFWPFERLIADPAGGSEPRPL